MSDSVTYWQFNEHWFYVCRVLLSSDALDKKDNTCCNTQPNTGTITFGHAPDQKWVCACLVGFWNAWHRQWWVKTIDRSTPTMYKYSPPPLLYANKKRPPSVLASRCCVSSTPSARLGVATQHLSFGTCTHVFNQQHSTICVPHRYV